MPTLDEELEEHAQEEQARREDLQAEQEEERQRRQQAQQELRNQIRQQARQQAVKKAKSAATSAAKKEIWADIIAAVAPVVGIILLAFAIIVLIVVIIVVLCNSTTWTGRLARLTSSITSVITGTDYCKALGSLAGVSKVIDQGQIPPPGGQICPADVIPNDPNQKPYIPNLVVDCTNCVSLRAQDPNIQIKPEPTTHDFVAQSMEAALQRLFAKNQNFIITEAFCPTAKHASPAHYNGKAVDMKLADGSANPAELDQLILDAQSVGFINILCEYRVGTLPRSQKPCNPVETTTGDNIHFEVP